MSVAAPWNVALPDLLLIGSILEIEHNDAVFITRVRDAEIAGHKLIFTLAWAAVYNVRTEKLAALSVQRYEITTTYDLVHYNAEEKNWWARTEHGFITLTPFDRCRPLEHRIEGLPPRSERFLALHPDLAFEPAALKHALLVASTRGRTINTDVTSVREIVEQLPCEAAKEHFLWDYIVALTKDPNAFCVIY